MENGLAPYPSYKDSGIPWLGKVPEHWLLLPNRSIFWEVIDRNHSDEEMLSVTIKQGVIRQETLLQDSSKKDSSNEDKVAYKLVQPGDLAYNKMRAWQGAIGASEYRGIISPAYIVIRPRRAINPTYFHYLLRTPMFAKEAERWSYGITSDQWSLRHEHFRMIYSPLPPLAEQNAIVRYLDYMDRRIRRYIRARQKLIKLLNEQKQTIIHQAVTRGLDPNVRLKPSGVAWLGDVPEHWEVLRSKYIFQEIDQRSSSGEETHLSMSQRFGLIPSSDIDEHRLLSENYVGAKICEAEDLVLNRLKAHLGVFALAPQQGLVSPDYTVFRPVRHISPKYYEYVLRTPACRVEFRKRAKGIVQGFWRLYTDDFYEIGLPVPPSEEQEFIVEHLQGMLGHINTLIDHTDRDIQLIHEYRTRLIADVVTGKLDVRAAAAALPDESAAPETLEIEETPEEDAAPGEEVEEELEGEDE